MDNLPDERRQTKDIVIYLLRVIAVVGWLLFILAFGVSYVAAPDGEYSLYGYNAIEQIKLAPLTAYIYIVLWTSSLSSYLCLILDKYRSRRRSDNKHFNFMLLMLIAMAWFCYLFIGIKG